MKKRILLTIMAAFAFAGCQNIQLAEPLPFVGSTEAYNDDTRTTLDEGKVLWKRGDQISIFAGHILNERYQVTDDSDGHTSAAFNAVSPADFVSGVDIPNNVAYYPYADNNELIQKEGFYELSTSLPSIQQYAEDSFGAGAFPMTAVTPSTSDYNLKFKNILGGLKLQLKGEAIIASISIQGNAGEPLCGEAIVSVEEGGVPSIMLSDENAATVTLDCGEGVQLSNTEATSFVIALPPATMSRGFTVTVRDIDGRQIVLSTDRPQTIIRSQLLKMPVKEYVGALSVGQPSNELCFTAEEAGSIITLNKIDNPYYVPQEYCTDGEHWYEYTFGTPITLENASDKVYFRKMTYNMAEGFSIWYDGHYSFKMSGKIAASGNVMSLIDKTCQSTTIPNVGCFYDLFRDCTSLTEAPELPATTLANRCYDYMFSGCTSLTTAPELPATSMEYRCYSYMFSNCTSLTTAPELPATTLADECYTSMFVFCASLTKAPELPATTMAERCYSSMFSNCTSLTTAPELPATTLADRCYQYMFNHCTSLTTAPELPATTLADRCYNSMFGLCTSLTKAPELPATTLASGCYDLMFYGCSSLSEIMCYATDIHGTTSWLSEVAANGTFHAAPSAFWSRGSSGIPEGWKWKISNNGNSEPEVIWGDDFSWLRGMINEYNANNYPYIGNAVTGYDETDYTGASNANAPNAYKVEPFKSKFPAALAAAGYEDMHASEQLIYPQDEYLKFGKTSYHTSLKIKALPLTETADLTLEFDWCRHVQNTGKVDPVTLTVVITGDGTFENGTKYSDPLETNQYYVEGKYAEMGFTHSEVKIKDAGANTQLNFVYTDCLDKNTGRYNWYVSGAHRYHIDNIKIIKE